MKTVVIALLDKAWPPAHSFVDGMLATEAASQPDIQMRLCVSRTPGEGVHPQRYRRAAALPRLFPRRGAGRLLNLVVALRLIVYQVVRERRRKRRVVLFVRNDPVYLLAASILRRWVDRLVFQSSFPHEEYSGNAIKRGAARLLYRVASQGVDVVTGVSPEGVRRAHGLCPHAAEGAHIPLLSDLPLVGDSANYHVRYGMPVFLYAGTHRSGRELETVLDAIVQAVERGCLASFRFVGAAAEDERRLSSVPGVAGLIQRRIIQIDPPVSRDDLRPIMAEADVGISLIPPKAVYYEASPTKLSEYMGAGLAILASRGIPMQERFVCEAQAGVLVEWNVSDIADAIISMSADHEAIRVYRENSERFAQESLQYRSYLPLFRELIGTVE